MGFKTFSLLVLVGFLTLASSASAGTKQEIAAGKKIAEKLCARCHAVERTGLSPNQKAPAFRTFAQKWPVENLEEALAEGIVVGAHIMPEFEFEPQEITNLLAHIEALSTKP